ncbi:hypothetical protein PQR39_21080 [Paraburkholderia sediminicola]|uniref:hypothetical protein n=1 Tax=Paraburkholderia sediminicola TaxID=458836 RepID=UPI0038BA50E6
MNKLTIEAVAAEAARVADAAWQRLDGRVTDPQALRDVVAALDEVRESLLKAGETASLQDGKLLAVIYANVDALQAQAVSHLHEVEIDCMAKAILMLGTKTLH